MEKNMLNLHSYRKVVPISSINSVTLLKNLRFFLQFVITGSYLLRKVIKRLLCLTYHDFFFEYTICSLFIQSALDITNFFNES